MDYGLAPQANQWKPSGAPECRVSARVQLGTIAFSRGDRNVGEFEDTVILQTFGEVLEAFERQCRACDRAQRKVQQEPNRS
jgi:hypothetical protein